MVSKIQIVMSQSDKEQNILQKAAQHLANNARWWHKFYPDFKCYYGVVPKVACTTLRRIFVRMHGVSNEQMMDSHEKIEGLIPHLRCYPVEYIYQILCSSEFFKFTVVRNPYSRLVSAYQHKMVNLFMQCQNEMQQDGRSSVEYIGEFFHHDVMIRLRNNQPVSVPIKSGAVPVSFASFVNYVCKPHQPDIHWLAQHKMNLHGVIPYDFIAKMENFKADIAYVFTKIGAKAEAYTMLDEKINATDQKEKPWQEYYTEELAEMVYQAYREDFIQFDYDKEIR
jgi:hypothetical protein